MSKKPAESSAKPSRLPPSSNWLALQKSLKPARKKEHQDFPRKRRKIDHSPSPSARATSAIMQASDTAEEATTEARKNGESLPALRKMIFGNVEYVDAQQQPGKYLALDCEMVGVGPEGAESSLARVSLVNYHGAVQLDEFVRQRERVVDYRTEFSGVRETDMVNAKPFDQVQQQVAALLDGRILVGHAVYNDLKALLLAHPWPQTRDTQHYAGRFKVAKSKHVALRHLVKQELDVTIQGGEHSSVTDARATMAVFRLHRKEWEKGSAPLPASQKRAREHTEEEQEEQEEEEDVHAGAGKKGAKTRARLPGGGRKGVSSGLSTIVRRSGRGASAPGNEEKSKGGGKSGGGGGTQWWKELGGAGRSKGSMRL
ncbi:ribonuclease H-like domain-containing protein [Mycena pura]|uniref:RNA exonuclease 4 n=1 Tax=Mycena pura TaxID=153505 RepID=A0AAD6V2X0_9AGAR|nr:ribonuclease H-like domain-containing protein [Mycena pura]